MSFFIVQPDENVEAPVFFNQAFDIHYDIEISDGEQDLLCFMAPGIKLLPEASKKIQDIFEKRSYVNHVYADHNLLEQDWTEFRHRAFSFDMCQKHIINTPIVCRASVPMRFNESLQHWYYLDFIRQASKMNILWHIPEILFSVPSQPDAQQELKRVLNE